MGASASHDAAAAPATMRRVVLVRPAEKIEDAQLQIETVPVPKPASGEVLIRVMAAPVNPSDYGKLKGTVDPAKEWTPTPMGNEGSGVVIASGGGLLAQRLLGKNVGFMNLKKQGSWAEYVTASAMTSVFPLPVSEWTARLSPAMMRGTAAACTGSGRCQPCSCSARSSGRGRAGSSSEAQRSPPAAVLQRRRIWVCSGEAERRQADAGRQAARVKAEFTGLIHTSRIDGEALLPPFLRCEDYAVVW